MLEELKSTGGCSIIKEPDNRGPEHKNLALIREYFSKAHFQNVAQNI